MHVDWRCQSALWRQTGTGTYMSLVNSDVSLLLLVANDI